MKTFLSSVFSRKLIRWSCIGISLILLLSAAAAFFLPRLINKEMVRAKIVHLLSLKIAGTVTFEDADISLFPLPRVIIRNASLTIPEKMNGTIGTVTVFPELRPLFVGQVKISKIQINQPSFTLRIPPKTDDNPKSLDEIAASLRSLTLGSADIRLSIDHGSLVLEKSGQSPVSVKEIGLRVQLASTNDDIVLTIDRLSSKDPGVFLSGAFRVNPAANMISLEAKGKGLDISSIRNAALGLAGDVLIVQKIIDILRSGTVEQISFESRGSAAADLGKTANIKIKGRLNKGNVVISRLELDFGNVSGDCDITGGILTGSDLKGQIMHSRISDGKLRIGLKGKDALFQADAAVSADLKDIHVVLSRLVKNPEFHQELGHIQAIDGNAEGRLALGDSLASVRAKVEIAKMKFSASYDRVPLPLAVEQGSFSYEGKGVAVKNLAGTIGKSALSGLSARLQTGERAFLDIQSGKGNIDTKEVHAWLTSYEKLKEPLRKIESLSGRLNLSSLMFQGLVMNSKDWDFKVSGSAERLMIKTSLLPGALNVNSGRFETQTGKLTIADAGISFLDASSVISGSLNTSLESVSKGDIRFSGTFGPKALHWLQTAFSIPEYVRTDQTISASEARLTWQDKGEATFQAALKTEFGQSVAIGLTKGRDRLVISRLDISDTVSKALLSFDLQENRKELNFKGRLDTSTAAGLITTPQVQGGMVKGEITADYSEGDVAGIIAQGRLQGEKIVLPWKKEMPLRIDSLDMSAEKGSITISSARLMLNDNAIFLKGNIASKTVGLVVDMDISSDRIVWDAIAKPDGDSLKEQQQGKKKKPVTVQGVVRLKAAIFEYGGIQAAPFNADIVMSAKKTDIKVGRSGLCGINMTGDISLSAGEANGEIALDIRFDAANQELKPTVLCLSKSRSDATGHFTVKGQVKGRGRAEDLKKVVEGKIDFSADHGTVYRYKTLDTVFDFLNKGEEFKGQLPDLDKSELSYELFKINASVGNGSLIVEEAIFDSALIEVVAQGSLNLIDNQLDLNVMVAPLRQVNKLIGKVPIVGTVFGGSVITVPVRVTGTPADPQVTYLSPSAVASGLVGMMKRTLNLPVSILSPLFPKEKQE